jgi:MFS family permease
VSSSKQTSSIRRVAWLLCFSVISTTAINMVRTVVAYKVLHLGFSAGVVGLVAGAFGFIPLLVAIPLGRRMDRSGGRWVLAAGAGLLIGGAVLMGTSVRVPGLMVGNAMYGLGHLFTLLGIESEVASLEPSKRTAWFGYLTASHSLCQMIGPLLAGWVFTHAGPNATPAELVLAARNALLASALAVGVALLIERFLAGPPAEARSSSEGEGQWTVGALFRIEGIFKFFWMSMVVTVSLDLLSVYLPVLGEYRGATPATVGMLLALRAGAALTARAFIAPVTRWVGERKLLVLCVAIPLLMCVVLAAIWDTLVIAIAVIIGGFFLGFGQPMAITNLVGLVPRESVGTALSVRLAANRLGVVAVPAGAGAIAGVLGPAVVFLILGGMFGVSLVQMMRAPAPRESVPV